jgi:nucleotide-binding universal stress UspA family protein
VALATVTLALIAGADSAPAMHYALDLAARSRAFLSAAVAVPPLAVPALAYSGYAVATQMLMVIESENLARREDAESKAELLRSEAAKLGLACEVEVLSTLYDPVTPPLVARARVSDLCVVSTPPPGESTQRDLMIDLLFGAGAPILAVPPDWRGGPVAKVLIAWDGGRAAARAVHDASPLLREAQTVEIVCVEGEKPLELASAEALAAHLARFCKNVSINVLQAREGVAATLRDHALQQSADLLVMGAYGHSRLREFVLGGATREMLTQFPAPTLMSH